MSLRDFGALLNSRVGGGLVLLACVLLLGTAGYMAIEGWSFLDAFYMSVTTITTVGYREVHPLSTGGRVFTLFLVLTGVGAAFYILTAMVAAIIEGDLRQVFGARRLRLMIEHIEDHYIVCGYGRVGQEIAVELLQRKAPFVIVDTDPEVVEKARGQGLLVVLGDATLEDTLREAHVDRCKSLIAASDSDATNTYITLTAKGVRPNVYVVARVSTPVVEAKLRLAGADRVISPYSIAGRRMALAAVQPSMTDFIDILPAGTTDERILAEFVIDVDSNLAGKQLGEALENCRDVVAVAVRDAAGRLTVGPPRSTPLVPGETLLLIGDEEDLGSLGVVLSIEQERRGL